MPRSAASFVVPRSVTVSLVLLVSTAGSLTVVPGCGRFDGGSPTPASSDSSSGVSNGSPGEATADGRSESTGDADANVPPCPSSPPWPGHPCALVGQECDYSGPGGGYCGNVTAICATQGYWQSAGVDCPAAGCPSALPSNGEACSQRGLRCTYPLNAMTCDAGACGGGWSCGTVGCRSASDAVCGTWECGCGSSGSWACDGGDCQGGDAGNDCPVCDGVTQGFCDCPCRPPASGEGCAAEACNYGNGTVADCMNGHFWCFGPACPPPICTNPEAKDSVCCGQGTAGVYVDCDADGGLTCKAGYSLCRGGNACPCPDSGSGASEGGTDAGLD